MWAADSREPEGVLTPQTAALLQAQFPQSAADHHTCFHSVTNIHLQAEGTKTKIFSPGSHAVLIVAVYFSPSGLTKALYSSYNSTTAVTQSMSCKTLKQPARDAVLRSNLPIMSQQKLLDGIITGDQGYASFPLALNFYVLFFTHKKNISNCGMKKIY